MPLETASYINQLVSSNPLDSDQKLQGDENIRLLKTVVKNTFPNITAAITATTTELNYCKNLVRDAQTQINLKAPINSAAFTGVPTAPYPDGSSDDQMATAQYVQDMIATPASLPGQTGRIDWILSTDGANGKWTNVIDILVVKPSTGTDFLTTDGVQTARNKTLVDGIFTDSVLTSKELVFDTSGITTGTTKTVSLSQYDTIIDVPDEVYVGTNTYPGGVSGVMEVLFDNTKYDQIYLEFIDLQWTGISTFPAYIYWEFKVDGTWQQFFTAGQGFSGTAPMKVYGALVYNFVGYKAVIDMWLPSVSKSTTQRGFGVFTAENDVGSGSSLVSSYNNPVSAQKGKLEGVRLSGAGKIGGTVRIYGVPTTWP